MALGICRKGFPATCPKLPFRYSSLQYKHCLLPTSHGLTALTGWDYSLFGGMPANDDSMALQQSMLSECSRLFLRYLICRFNDFLYVGKANCVNPFYKLHNNNPVVAIRKDIPSMRGSWGDDEEKMGILSYIVLAKIYGAAV